MSLTVVLLVLLEIPSFLVATGADPHRVVPAAGGHGTALLRAVIAHALPTGPTVMDGEARGELSLALVAGVNVLIWDPVGRASGVFHQAQRYVNGTNNSSQSVLHRLPDLPSYQRASFLLQGSIQQLS